MTKLVPIETGVNVAHAGELRVPSPIAKVEVMANARPIYLLAVSTQHTRTNKNVATDFSCIIILQAQTSWPVLSGGQCSV